MATVQIMYWRDIPAQIRSKDESQQVKEMLPDRFQDAVDQAAMLAEATGTDAFLAGWQWGDLLKINGTAGDALAIVRHDILSTYTEHHLKQLVQAHRK